MTDTALDQAFAAMQAAPDDDAARLSYFARIAESELFLMLTGEPEGENIEPALVEQQGVQYALVFDREERLSDFSKADTPYVAVSGRLITQMLAGEGIGLAINLDVAPSAFLLPPEAVAWLSQVTGEAPSEELDRPVEIGPPAGLPETLLQALDGKLATAAGLARNAYLVRVGYESGRQGHLLALTDAIPGAEESLARAINEALVFSGIEAGALDVAFLRASDPVAATVARHGLRFELPSVNATGVQRAAPGSDPAKPPILK